MVSQLAFISHFISPASRSLISSRSRSRISFRPATLRWRAAVSGASNPPSRPFDSGDTAGHSSGTSGNQSAGEVQNGHSDAPYSERAKTGETPQFTNDDSQSDVLSKFHSLLGDSTVAIDPVKNVPVALIDASGALQLDDGSFSPVVEAPSIVRRARRKVVDFNFLRRQLAEGFNSGVGAAVLLTILFGTWYWSNTAFNVFNKRVLKVFPYPVTCSAVQFAVAGVIMSIGWLIRVRPFPKINRFSLNSILPLGFLHAAGFLLTNVSLGKVSVAFTHTIKSTEPFFSVALTPGILGDVPTWGIIGSLFPIVTGVAIASATDVSFNWPGFLSAIGSNLALQSRNVLSKRLMNSSVRSTKAGQKRRKLKSLSDDEFETLATLDNVNLFSTMSIVAFFVLLPICLLTEGVPLVSSAISSVTTGMPTSHLIRMLLLGGLCRCLDVLSSYMILKRVSPVTHSIGNSVKRAVVIVASIFFFQTKMTSLNIIGTTFALFGVLCYSLIVSACKQNTFGPDSPFCRPIYTDEEVELTEGGGI